jgi:hypothetical protein
MVKTRHLLPMRISLIVYVLILLFSCTERDIQRPIQGFWVSDDYKSGKSFQTLTISRPDTNMYGSIPFLVETNQYGAYSFIEPLDTIHGQFEAYGPHWETAFILNLEGDKLVQTFSVGETDERKVKYIRVDSLQIWREAIFSDLLLQIDLPHANESDNLVPRRSYLVSHLFLGPLKDSLKAERPAIARDSTALQIFDVLIESYELERFLRNEQAKQDETNRDSIIVVLNADSKISEGEINEWVGRIKSYNPKLRVWQRCIDLNSRKFRYRKLSD